MIASMLLAWPWMVLIAAVVIVVGVPVARHEARLFHRVRGRR